MTVMRLTDDKINVVFIESDLSGRGLSYEKLDYRELSTRKFFKDALEVAKKQVGFCADSGRLIIETHPCRGGGCVVSFTRLPKELPPEESFLRFCYKAIDGNALLDAMQLLDAAGAEYSVLHSEGAYYIICSENQRFLSEFCERQNSEYAIEHILEFGKKLR